MKSGSIAFYSAIKMYHKMREQCMFLNGLRSSLASLGLGALLSTGPTPRGFQSTSNAYNMSQALCRYQVGLPQ